jgi:hypothetical protein
VGRTERADADPTRGEEGGDQVGAVAPRVLEVHVRVAPQHQLRHICELIGQPPAVFQHPHANVRSPTQRAHRGLGDRDVDARKTPRLLAPEQAS